MRAARLLLYLCATVVCLASPEASVLAWKARRAEKAGHIQEAYLLYAQAAAADPNNRTYWSKAHALQTRALLEQADRKAAETAPEKTDEGEDPQLEADLLEEQDTENDPSLPFETLITDRDLRETRKFAPPPELAGDAGKKSLDLREEARALWEKAVRSFGLEATFEREFPQTGQPVRLRLEEVDFRDAIRALELATSSFVVPLGPRRLLVVKDTQQKRQELEPTVALVVSLPDTVNVQEAQELARTVQQTMEIQKFMVDGTRRLALMRDRISKVRPAAQLFDQMLLNRTQVAVELELFNVSSNITSSYGVRLPTSTALVDFGKVWNSVASVPDAFTQFATFGGGKTLIGIGLTGAEMFANMSNSIGKSVLRAELRSTDNQPATFHVGDRFPILTAGYFGTVTGDTGNGQVYTPPPSFTFEDLGLSIKVTPHVHGMDEMTLEVETEFKLLTGASSNGIPVISNRKFTSRIRLRNGEWAALAGLINSSEAKNLGGIAGLSQLPLLGPLLRTTDKSTDRSETLILLKPRLLSLPPTDSPVRPLYVGPEGRPVTPL